jgi:xanthine dehydrogenase accessory factor
MGHELTAEMARLIDAGEAFALATLVDAHGSTPQRVGARLLVRSDGTTAGTLGGGCIEAEVHEVARDAIRTRQPRLLDFTLNEDIAVDYGLACGGTERIFVDPTFTTEDAEIVRRIGRAGDGVRGVVFSVLETTGPAALASRTAVWEDGVAQGHLGPLQAEALARGRGILAEPRPRSTIVTFADGTIAFADVAAEPPEVVIVGAGHVGRAIATVAATLGYRMTVIDDRADFANAQRFPEAAKIVADDIEIALEGHRMTRNTAVVIVTRGHKHDYQALSAAVRSEAGYIGLMGSRRKVTLIYRQLVDDGVPPDRLRDVHAPIGLDIGAVSPEEIAVSIMAEITMHRQGGTGAPMRDDRLIERAQPRPVS